MGGTFTIDVAPHNGENVSTTLSGSSLTYSSPTTTSLGSPQQVTLFYSSSHAAPRGFIQVDVTDNTGTPPEKYSIRLTNSSNTSVTFTNGVQENFYLAGAGTTRLAAQFDAGGLSTGIHAYTVSVRKWRTGAVYDEATAAVKVIVVNERTSAYRAGWSVAGVQRLAVVGDDVLLVDGNGGALAFRRTGSGATTFTTPPGDFSKLVELAGSTGYRRTTNDSTRHYFSSVGRLDSVVDRFGLSWRFAYDGSGKLARIRNPIGKRDTLIYDGSGKIWQIKDPANRAVTLTVNGSGDLAVAVDADSDTAIAATYDAAHRLSYWLDRGGARSDVAYDTAGTVATATSPTLTADGASVRPQTTFRSLQTTVLPATGTGTTLSGAATRVLPADVKVRTTDPRGKITHTTLDRFGNVLNVEAPHSSTTVIARNTHSQVTRTVSPSGHTVRNEWSGARLTQVRDSTLGDTINYEHNQWDGVTRMYGTTAPEMQNFYDALGALDSTVMVGTNVVTRYTYGTHYLPLTKTDAGGHTTVYLYDPVWGNLAEVQTGSSSQRVTTLRYDAYGRVRARVDAQGQRDSTVYDVIDRPLKAFNAAGDSVVYTYDDVSMTEFRDAIGQTYGFVRNAVGWVESQTDPRGLSTQHRYDRNGNQTSLINRRGQTISATYDDLNRPLTRTDGATSAVTTYAYDPGGRWTMTNNAESRDSTFLDVAGRVTSTVTVRGGTRYVLTSAYNRRGQRTSLAMTAPWSRTIGYRYNAKMLLDTLIDVAGGATRMTYDADGVLIDTYYPTSLQVQPSVPSSHLAAGTYYTALGTRPLTHWLLQDYVGRTAERWRVGEDTATAYTYHGRGHLERALTFAYEPSPLCTEPTTSSFDSDFGWRVQPSAEPDCEGFTTDVDDIVYLYDAVGNPLSGMDTGNRLLAAGGDTMQYDADGNLTSKIGNGTTQTFAWNGLGQMTSATTNGTTTYYHYDGAGRRVRKASSSATLTRYLYDGQNLFMELDGSSAIVREYTYFPGVDQPHSVRQGGSIYYYMTEGPGNVVGLVNSSNQLVNHYRYDPFGNATLTTEGVANPLRYTGRELDAESGLYYYRARYYDPEVRRFISEDPIGLAGGVNPYVYVGNDPINGRDPFGMKGKKKGKDESMSPGMKAIMDLMAFMDEWTSTHAGGSGIVGFGGFVNAVCHSTSVHGVLECARDLQRHEATLVLRAINGIVNPHRVCVEIRGRTLAAYAGDRIKMWDRLLLTDRGDTIDGDADFGTQSIHLYSRAWINARLLAHEGAHLMPHTFRVLGEPGLRVGGWNEYGTYFGRPFKAYEGCASRTPLPPGDP